MASALYLSPLCSELKHGGWHSNSHLASMRMVGRWQQECSCRESRGSVSMAAVILLFLKNSCHILKPCVVENVEHT